MQSILSKQVDSFCIVLHEISQAKNKQKIWLASKDYIKFCMGNKLNVVTCNNLIQS